MKVGDFVYVSLAQEFRAVPGHENEWYRAQIQTIQRGSEFTVYRCWIEFDADEVRPVVVRNSDPENSSDEYDAIKCRGEETNRDLKAVVKAPECVAKYVEAQPAPNNDPTSPALWPLIISDIRINHDSEVSRLVATDMQKRHEFGIAKYGVPLVAKNDRDHLADAYQELLDAIVYLRAEIEKRGGMPHPKDPRKLETIAKWDRSKSTKYRLILRVYAQTIENTIELRGFILERDGR